MTQETPTTRSLVENASQPRRRNTNPVQRNPSYDLIVQNLQANGTNWSFSPRAIGVTSSVGGEGVTTVASNLAITAANSTADRVLLVDANLGKPNSRRTLRGASHQPGLFEVLTGEAELSDCIQETRNERVSFLSAGKRVRRDGLAGVTANSIEALIEHLKYEFQLVILDLPTAQDTSTCLKLAGILDGILLVVGAGGAPREQIRKSSTLLKRSGGNVLGIVLNKSSK